MKKVLLQGTMWHFIQIIWFLLVSHTLRNVWSFWYQLIPHSALEVTVALIFSPVFHFFQQACVMLLLITQHSKLQYPDTNPITFTFSGSLSLAPLHRPVQDRFKLCLILLCSNWKSLINFNCRIKPWLLTFFALPSSMNGARNGQAFLLIPSARAHPSYTCQMLSFPLLCQHQEDPLCVWNSTKP